MAKVKVPDELLIRWSDVAAPGTEPTQEWLIEEARHVLSLIDSGSMYDDLDVTPRERATLKRQLQSYIKAVRS